jgi:DNA polymerase-3 subunit chi
MKNNAPVKVIFYRVKDNSAKIQLIYTKAQEAFQHEKRLLIAVPNLQAAQYIDALLWKFPEESFMPHVIADAPTAEWIAITMQEQQNINQAARLLNLCPTPSALYQQVEEVYDLLDESHPQKLELSQQRLRLYQAKGLVVYRSEFKN